MPRKTKFKLKFDKDGDAIIPKFLVRKHTRGSKAELKSDLANLRSTGRIRGWIMPDMRKYQQRAERVEEFKEFHEQVLDFINETGGAMLGPITEHLDAKPARVKRAIKRLISQRKIQRDWQTYTLVEHS